MTTIMKVCQVYADAEKRGLKADSFAGLQFSIAGVIQAAQMLEQGDVQGASMIGFPQALVTAAMKTLG